MKKKKIIIGIGVLVVAFFVFATWYKIHYSMDVVESFEVNSSESKQRVMIATQGSEFKKALVAGIIDHLKQKHAYIKVVDVTTLPQVKEDNWNAVVVLHTWEQFKPPSGVTTYLERVKDMSKVVVLATSGNSTDKIEGIDAISTASEMADISARTSEINNRLDSILERN